MNGTIRLGIILCGLIGLMAFCSFFLDTRISSPSLSERLSRPSLEHPFGQDQLGQDIFSQVIQGARTSLTISLTVTVITLIIGLLAGSLAGYYGGWPDLLLMRIVDFLLAFPGLLLAFALAAVLPPSKMNIILILSVVGWTSYARLVRGLLLSLKEREFIMAATALGVSSFRLFWRHLWPQIPSSLLIQASFGISSLILAESSLTFLGLGLPIHTPSWGRLLLQGKEVLLEAPFVSIFPGVAIMIAVLGFNLLGEGLRDYLDPRIRKT